MLRIHDNGHGVASIVTSYISETVKRLQLIDVEKNLFDSRVHKLRIRLIVEHADRGRDGLQEVLVFTPCRAAPGQKGSDEEHECRVGVREWAGATYFCER